MCGLLLAINHPKKIGLEDLTNTLLERGPDECSFYSFSNVQLVHTRLAISSSASSQPHETNDGKVVIYNGESYSKQCVYGGRPELNDIFHIINNILEKGEISYEFSYELSFVMIDKRRLAVCIFRDYFGTKPLFIARSIDNRLYISSSTRQIKLLIGDLEQIAISRMPSNYYNEIALDSLQSKFNLQGNITSRAGKYDILDNAFNYERWVKCFEESVLIRLPIGSELFIPLSSGIDSGILATCILKMKVSCTFYIIPNGENQNILAERIRYIQENSSCNVWIIDTFKHSLDCIDGDLTNGDDYCYINDSFQSGFVVSDDPASRGCHLIYKYAKANGFRVAFSGQGGDEIYGDYGVKTKYNNLNCSYCPPSCLSKTIQLDNLFPWQNIHSGRMAQYLLKEELISSSFSIENRYPLLDIPTVLEYLKIDMDHPFQKGNKELFKQYIRDNEFPVDKKNDKRGFNPFSKDNLDGFMNVHKHLILPII